MRAKIIYTKHPSHSVNYNKNSVEKRTDLLNSISEACRELRLRSPAMFHSGLFDKNKTQPAASPHDTRWVETLLWALIKLCIGPWLRLPPKNMEADGFYRLEARYHMHFLRIRRDLSAILHPTKQIAYVLIPLFRRLNGCLKRTSWFMSAYEANWSEISCALTQHLHGMEYARDVLASHASSTDQVVGKLASTNFNASGILLKGEMLTLRIASLLGKNGSSEI